MRYLMAVVLVAVVNWGCKHTYYALGVACKRPSVEAQNSADYGSPITQVQAEKLVALYMEQSLFDAYSAYFKFSKLRTGYYQSRKNNCLVTYGYFILFAVNAKNRYGGYTGYQQRRAWIRNGYIHSLEYANVNDLKIELIPRTLMEILKQSESERPTKGDRI